MPKHESGQKIFDLLMSVYYIAEISVVELVGGRSSVSYGRNGTIWSIFPVRKSPAFFSVDEPGFFVRIVPFLPLISLCQPHAR